MVRKRTPPPITSPHVIHIKVGVSKLNVLAARLFRLDPIHDLGRPLTMKDIEDIERYYGPEKAAYAREVMEQQEERGE